MRSLIHALRLFAVVTLLATLASAASITGTVKGSDGAPFQGAFVQAQNTKTRMLFSVLSNAQGKYYVDQLPEGTYRLQVRAPGYKTDPVSGLTLTADQKTSHDFALAKGIVRWADISLYQGEKLLPDGPGKAPFFRFAACTACHGFQSRMASVSRDLDGWKDRIHFMRDAMGFFLNAPYSRFTDQDAEQVAQFLNSSFGPDSTLPKSVADMPGYKDTVRSFSSQAMNIVYVEYDLPGPNRMPWSAAPDKEGNFWLPYYGDANKIGRLNPNTAEVKEWQVPNVGTAAIHSAVADSNGVVWFTEQASNKLGKWDPKTQQITEYQDTAGKHTVRIAPNGEVWFTGGFGKFDPETSKFTHYPEVQGAYGIAIDQQGNPWFAEFMPDGQIGRVDVKTGKVQKWSPPSKGGRPRRLQIDSDGTVWFAEFSGGRLAHFDPKTEQFKEYTLPGPEATPYALSIDKDHNIWYASEWMDVVGRLDPKTGQVLEYPFPQSENAMREFFYDSSSGRTWFGTPPNNKVGYFYLAKTEGK